MPRRHLIGLLLILAAGSALFASNVLAEAWFEFDRTVEVKAPVHLELTLTAGKVSITRGGADRLQIEGIKRVWGHEWEDAKRVADLIEVGVYQGGDKVEVATTYHPLPEKDKALVGEKFEKGAAHYGNVDYRITAPDFASITIRGEAADIELISLQCDVLIENGHGAVSTESLEGDLRIRQHTGDVVLSNIEGAIDVDNGSGQILGEFLFGPLTLRQSGGEIALQWVEGDIRIKSFSSHVSIQQTRGAVDVQSDDGDVYVKTELDSPRDFFVQTNSGGIVFSVPERSAGMLKVRTKSGEIVTEVPVAVQSMTANYLEGVFGRGGTNVELSSNSGDVTLATY